MTLRTRSFVGPVIRGWSANTSETVVRDTPAASATSLIVARRGGRLTFDGTQSLYRYTEIGPITNAGHPAVHCVLRGQAIATCIHGCQRHVRLLPSLNPSRLFGVYTRTHAGGTLERRRA